MHSGGQHNKGFVIEGFSDNQGVFIIQGAEDSVQLVQPGMDVLGLDGDDRGSDILRLWAMFQLGENNVTKAEDITRG